MANPLTPEEEQAIISQYWGLAGDNAQASGAVRQPTSTIVDPAQPPPPPPAAFQPNPGAPGYNPNPGNTPSSRAVLGNDPPVPKAEQGPIGRAFSSSEPVFQNPLAKPVQAPIDMGDVGEPVGVNGGELDAPRGAPIGPSPSDDAEFAAFRAKQDAGKASDQAKIASYWGAAPTKANPDPFGMKAAQDARLGAFDAQMGAMGRARDADAVKAVQIAEGQRDLARMQDEDAAISRAQADLERKHFDEGMQEIGRELDDVRAKKIDPLRLMKEQPALGVLAVVGGGLSGFYQGITGGHENQFLADIDRQIDRGMAEDERQIRDNKFALDGATNLLHQQRASQKDDNLAQMQSRNLTYEAVKQEIASQAAESDVPAAKARADEMIAQVQGAQAALQQEIARQKQAQAVSLAAAGMAQAKEVREFRAKIYEKMLAEGYSPAQAESESRRQVAVQYLGGVGARPRGADFDRPGMTREQRGKIASDQEQSNQYADEFNRQIDAMKKHPSVKRAGLDTAALAHLGGRIAPESAHDAQEIEHLNMMVRAAAGKMLKDADGKPTRWVQEELKDVYSMTPGEPEAMRLQKLDDAASFVNGLAREQGATNAPVPNRKAALSQELGAKPVR